MLTLLDLLNKFLGYFNIQDKAKGRALSLIALVGNGYLLVVAWQNLRYPGFRVRGALFLLAFLILSYFVVLNLIYYYTTKQSKFDISPRVEKALGGNRQHQQQTMAQFQQAATTVPALGMLGDLPVLPVTVSQEAAHVDALNTLVSDMVQAGAVRLDYAGLDEAAVAQVAKTTQQPVLAMGQPVALPFVRLAVEADTVKVVGGLNALNEAELGQVVQLGLTPIKEALKHYDLAVASVTIAGGEQKQQGRSGMVVTQHPYRLQVQLAYQAKKTE